MDWTPLTPPILTAGRLFVGNFLGHLRELSPADGSVVRRAVCLTDVIVPTDAEQRLQLKLSPDGATMRFINPLHPAGYITNEGPRLVELVMHAVRLDNFAVTVLRETVADVLTRPPAPPPTTTSGRTKVLAQTQSGREQEQAVPVLAELARDTTEKPQLRVRAIGDPEFDSGPHSGVPNRQPLR